MTGPRDVPSYRAVHDRLSRANGPASQHTCRCGAPARHWAYQHTGEPEAELWSEGGLVYTTNPADYAPMCQSCHSFLDDSTKQAREAHSVLLETDPEFRARWYESSVRGSARGGAAFAERLASDPEFRESHKVRAAQAAVLGGAASAERLATDPEFRDRWSKTARRAGALGGAAVIEKLTSDPGFRERWAEKSRRSGALAASIRRKCRGCDMVCSPGALGRHQKSRGHIGWDPVVPGGSGVAQ